MHSKGAQTTMLYQHDKIYLQEANRASLFLPMATTNSTITDWIHLILPSDGLVMESIGRHECH